MNSNSSRKISKINKTIINKNSNKITKVMIIIIMIKNKDKANNM